MMVKGVSQMLCAPVLMIAAATASVNAQSEHVRIAVAEFDYSDTSGEQRDQAADHSRRLKAFAEMIRNELANSGKYEVVVIDCAGKLCSAGTIAPADLFAAARQAGARLLLYGGIQKLSTLIQYAKAEAVDVKASRLVFDRLMTFRGDTDEAWAHAEHFLAREFLSQDVR
jgi:hypothetical protein